MGQAKNPLQTRQGLHRWKFEEVIDQTVLPFKQRINALAVENIRVALFAIHKGKIPANKSSRRQKAPEKDVRTEVHVMVTVNAVWRSLVKPAEFVELHSHNVFE
jgi:hypothetical protein